MNTTQVKQLCFDNKEELELNNLIQGAMKQVLNSGLATYKNDKI